MILHCGFTPNTDQMRPSFRRQRSKFTKVRISSCVVVEIVMVMMILTLGLGGNHFRRGNAGAADGRVSETV